MIKNDEMFPMSPNRKRGLYNKIVSASEGGPGPLKVKEDHSTTILDIKDFNRQGERYIKRNK